MNYQCDENSTVYTFDHSTMLMAAHHKMMGHAHAMCRLGQIEPMRTLQWQTHVCVL